MGSSSTSMEQDEPRPPFRIVRQINHGDSILHAQRECPKPENRSREGPLSPVFQLGSTVLPRVSLEQPARNKSRSATASGAGSEENSRIRFNDKHIEGIDHLHASKPVNDSAKPNDEGCKSLTLG